MCYNGNHKFEAKAFAKLIYKSSLSSDLIMHKSIKEELLVIVDQHRYGEPNKRI
jgi:hypothetical protein